jgi:hypothetical protein
MRRPTLLGVKRFLLRPVIGQTWREVAFLLAGGVTAIVGFCVQVVGLSAGLSLLITLIGIPILVALAYVDRWLCALEPHRATLVLRWIQEERRRTFGDRVRRGGTHGSPASPLLVRCARAFRHRPPAAVLVPQATGKTRV